MRKQYVETRGARSNPENSQETVDEEIRAEMDNDVEQNMTPTQNRDRTAEHGTEQDPLWRMANTQHWLTEEVNLSLRT
jgi:hypothetical protein